MSDEEIKDTVHTSLTAHLNHVQFGQLASISYMFPEKTGTLVFKTIDRSVEQSIPRFDVTVVISNEEKQKTLFFEGLELEILPCSLCNIETHTAYSFRARDIRQDIREVS